MMTSLFLGLKEDLGLNLSATKERLSFYYTENISSFLDYHLQPLAQGELMTDLLVKPTDTHQCLDPSSSHPCHCKKGIP